MDIGVGAVMFATGLSARKVRESFTAKKANLCTELFITIKGSIIIIVIGFLRFFLLKDLNYQVSPNLLPLNERPIAICFEKG